MLKTSTHKKFLFHLAILTSILTLSSVAVVSPVSAASKAKQPTNAGRTAATPIVNTILSGRSAPTSSIGVPGDFYLDLITMNFYGPKSKVKGWGLPTSLIGPTGAQGSPGPIGPQGKAGSKGEDGANAIGSAGGIGPQGVAGAPGSPGATGPQGPMGPAGPQGEPGPTGATGPGGTGPQGATGPQGIQGIQGEKGETGTVGPQGLTGSTGPQGAQGVQGPQGVQGAQGVQGPRGDTGATGAQGSQGIQGLKGDTGATGVQGVAGAQGPAGISKATLGTISFPSALSSSTPDTWFAANEFGIIEVGKKYSFTFWVEGAYPAKSATKQLTASVSLLSGEASPVIHQTSYVGFNLTYYATCVRVEGTIDASTISTNTSIKISVKTAENTAVTALPLSGHFLLSEVGALG